MARRLDRSRASRQEPGLRNPQGCSAALPEGCLAEGEGGALLGPGRGFEDTS